MPKTVVPEPHISLDKKLSDFSPNKNAKWKLKNSPSIPHDPNGRKSLAPHHWFEPPPDVQHEDLEKANFKVAMKANEIQSTAGLMKSELPRVHPPGAKRSQTG